METPNIDKLVELIASNATSGDIPDAVMAGAVGEAVTFINGLGSALTTISNAMAQIAQTQERIAIAQEQLSAAAYR